jgi:hypothetical protein
MMPMPIMAPSVFVLVTFAKLSVLGVISMPAIPSIDKLAQSRKVPRRIEERYKWLVEEVPVFQKPVKFVQPWKAILPSKETVTFLEDTSNSIRCKSLQPWKAAPPMEKVEEEGTNCNTLILPLIKYVQFSKAAEPMEETSEILRALGILPSTSKSPLSRAEIKL